MLINVNTEEAFSLHMSRWCAKIDIVNYFVLEVAFKIPCLNHASPFQLYSMTPTRPHFRTLDGIDQDTPAPCVIRSRFKNDPSLSQNIEADQRSGSCEGTDPVTQSTGKYWKISDGHRDCAPWFPIRRRRLETSRPPRGWILYGIPSKSEYLHGCRQLERPVINSNRQYE